LNSVSEAIVLVPVGILSTLKKHFTTKNMYANEEWQLGFSDDFKT
jgi:hypothetical protein